MAIQFQDSINVNNGSLYASGGIKVPYGASEHRPMIVLNGATTYGLFHTEAASDEFTFDFNGTQMFKFRQDGIFTINGNTITTGKVTNWDTAHGWGDHNGLYLGISDKAADSELLDGINSSQFVRSDQNSVTIGRHLDANTTWTNSALTLFLGWYGGKIVIGNNNDGGHDYASALGGNTIPILNKSYFYKAAKFEEDIQIDGNVNFLGGVGTWISSNVMTDSIGWNTNYGVYIGSNVGGTHYLRGNGTFTTGGSTYNLWHAGNFDPDTKEAAGAADAVNTRIDEEIIPLIDTKADASHEHQYIRTVLSTQEADDAMPSTGYALQHFLGKGPSNNDGHILGMTWTGTSIYGAQIWVDTDPNNLMAFRSRSNAGVWTRWNNLWHDGNLINVSQLTNDSGYINGDSIARFSYGTTDSTYSRFTHVRGGVSLNNPSGTGGAIRINLPVQNYNTNTMMSMTIKVYEYSTGKSFTLFCGGYNYNNGVWYNTFATLLGDNQRGDVPVKFGQDGTRNVIWIGNPDWGWSYPNVFITDFQSGHTQNANWNDEWEIVFDEEPAVNVTSQETAHQQISTANIGSQSVSFATSATNATNSNLLDNIDSTGFIRDYGTSAQVNIDTIGVTSGKYRWNSSTTGRPASGQSNEYGTLLHLNYDGNYSSQLAYDIAESNLYIRHLATTTDTGSSWKRLLTDSDLSSFDAAGAADAVNIRIDEEIIPLVDTKVSKSGDQVTGTLSVGGSAAYDSTNLALDVQGHMGIWGDHKLYFKITSNNYNTWSTSQYANGSQHRFNAQSFSFTNEGYSSSVFMNINSSGVGMSRNLVLGNEVYGDTNAYSNWGARLFFNGSNTDAQTYYYIGTNGEDYGGNYSKLDLRWHTGIRMGARPQYGGIRFFDDERLGTRIMSIGESDNNIRIDNNLWIGGAGGWITDLLNAKLGATAKAADSNLFDGIDSVNFVYGNANGTNDSVTTDADGLNKTGYYTSAAFTTRPSSVANWMYIEHIKLYNSNTRYQKQIGYDTYDNRMWVRTKNDNTWSGWHQIWTSDVFTNNSTDWNTAYGWGNHAGLYDATGSADSVNLRIDEEVLPLIDTKADASHTHDYLPLSGGTITGDLNIGNSRALSLFSEGTDAYVNIDARDNGDGARLHKYNRNAANTSYLPYYENWYDGNSYHSIGIEADKWRFSDSVVINQNLQVGDGMWVNGNNQAVYNDYNENLRLPPAGNNVSVIAFRATGEGGQPSSSILGYSDRHEVRINGAWKQRIYAGSIEYSSPIVVTGDIYTSSELNLPNTHSKTKIQLHGDGGNAHSIGTESFHNTYGPSAWTSGTLGHKFYGATNSLIATLGEGGGAAGRNTSTFYGNVRPSEDRVMTLGEEALRWQIVFCEILDSAGLHEKNLQNPKGEKQVGEYETGTVLVWKGGKNVPCTEPADHMRMGIAVKDVSSPLVQGAEPVLCTGKVNEGDYLVTSSVEGHAAAISPQYMRQHGLYDCVIGKALESAEGKSHLIKTWVNI